MKINLRNGPSFRRQGDAHRDAGRWGDAAAAYRRHLAERPHDQPIYVQLGHALKEDGRLIDALGAYAAAVALDDRDPDAAMYMAESLRRLGHHQEARDSYGRSFGLMPSEEAARQMLHFSRAFDGVPPVAAIERPTSFFVLQDLFGYLRAHSTMSGIQRVQSGIALHAMADAETSARFILNAIEARADALRPGEYWMIDDDDLAAIIGYASGDTVSHDVLRGMILNAERRATRVRPEAGSTIVLLGAFWGIGEPVSTYLHSHREGVRIGGYIYDIIPVTHPELCDDDLVVDFAMALGDFCSIADFALTISEASARELRTFLANSGGRSFPIETVPLAHHLTRDGVVADEGSQRLRRLRGRPYVAYVSTIEARKNHLYVVHAWRELIAQGIDVPDLVFVGRRGWKVDPLFEVLEATGNLGGRVHIVHDLTDGELNAVYAGSLFTVFTSIVEGWGLPVGESLTHGRPCVASSSSAIPEVGGDLVDYIDVANLRDGIAVFRRMIVDAAYREGRAAQIRERFVPSGWSDVARAFVATMKKIEGVSVDRSRLRLPPGLACPFGQGPRRIDLADYLRTPRRLVIELTGFYPYEAWGVWMRGAEGEMRIDATLPAGTPAYVYLATSATAAAAGCTLVIEDFERRGLAPIRHVLGRGGGALRVPVEIAEGGLVRLRFRIEGSFAPAANDTRHIAFGLRSAGYAGVDDLASRQELTEQVCLEAA